MEEGGLRQDSGPAESKNAKDDLRDRWRRLIESEERLNFFRKLVGWGLEVREIEHLGEGLHEKFKSEKMKGGRSEKVVVKSIMEMKLKDERRYQRELKEKRKEARGKLEEELGSKSAFNKVISVINSEAKKWRKLVKSKFSSKAEHLIKLRKKAEEISWQECPQEIIRYKNKVGAVLEHKYNSFASLG